MQRILQYYFSGRLSTNTTFLLDGSIKQYITQVRWIVGFSDETTRIINQILENTNIDLNDAGIFLNAINSFKLIENTINKENQWYIDEVKLFIKDFHTEKLDNETLNLLKVLELEASELEDPLRASQKIADAGGAARKAASIPRDSNAICPLTTNTIKISLPRRQQLFLLLKHYANQGSTYAQCRLSQMYFEKDGIPPIEYSDITANSEKLLYRLAQAFRWAKAAALSGHTVAALYLANYYENDYGIPDMEYISSAESLTEKEKALYRNQQTFQWRLASGIGFHPELRFQLSKYYAENFEGISKAEKIRYGKTEQSWQQYCLEQAYYWCRKSDKLGYEPARRALPDYSTKLQKCEPRIITTAKKDPWDIATCFLNLKDFLSFAKSCKSALMLARGNTGYWQSILRNMEVEKYYVFEDITMKSLDYQDLVRMFAKRVIYAMNWKKTSENITTILKSRMKEPQKKKAIAAMFDQIIACPLCGGEDKPRNHAGGEYGFDSGWHHMACLNCIEQKLWTFKEVVVLWGFSREQLESIPFWGRNYRVFYATPDLIELFQHEIIQERSFTYAIDKEDYQDIMDRLKDLPPEVRENMTISTKPCFKAAKQSDQAEDEIDHDHVDENLECLKYYNSLRAKLKLVKMKDRLREGIIRFGAILKPPVSKSPEMSVSSDGSSVSDGNSNSSDKTLILDDTRIEITIQHKFKPKISTTLEPDQELVYHTLFDKAYIQRKKPSEDLVPGSQSTAVLANTVNNPEEDSIVEKLNIVQKQKAISASPDRSPIVPVQDASAQIAIADDNDDPRSRSIESTRRTKFS